MEPIVTTKYDIVPSSNSPAVTSDRALRRGGNPFREALFALKKSPYFMIKRNGQEFSLYHSWGFTVRLKGNDTLTIDDFDGDGSLPVAYVRHQIANRGLRLDIHPEEMQIKETPLYGQEI